MGHERKAGTEIECGLNSTEMYCSYYVNCEQIDTTEMYSENVCIDDHQHINDVLSFTNLDIDVTHSNVPSIVNQLQSNVRVCENFNEVVTRSNVSNVSSTVNQQQSSVDLPTDLDVDVTHSNVPISATCHAPTVDPWSDLKHFRSKHVKNVLIGALNINSLRNKFNVLQDVLYNGFIDIFSVIESKLDESFPVNQFAVKGFHVHRQDVSATSGGIVTWIRSDLASNRRFDIEINNVNIQSTCVEIHIKQEKWFILSVYRLPSSCVNGFCEDLCKVIDKVFRESTMIVIIGDLNIDMSKCTSKSEKLQDVLNLYNLHNKITEPTCFKGLSSSVIDLCIVSKPSRFGAVFNKNCGLSDWHNFIAIGTKLNLPKAKTKVINYRSYKKFDEQAFKRDVSYVPFHLLDLFDDMDDKYWFYNHLISDVVNEHAPLKMKYIKGNNAPHMNSELKHLMYKKRMSQNAYWKKKGDIKLWETYRKDRNEFVKKSRLSRQEYFRIRCQKGAQDKGFWHTIKPYITDKVNNQDDIMLKEGDDIIINENDIVNVFNDYFKSITEHIGNNDLTDIPNVGNIKEKYSDHPSIKLINDNCNSDEIGLDLLTVDQVHKMLSKVNPKKATGCDLLPPRILHIARNELAPSLTSIINGTLQSAQFPNDLKLAEISPCFKKGNRLDKTMYRPVSILPSVSKVVESAIDLQISKKFYDKKAGCLSAYRKMHNTQSVLVKAIEDWKLALDNGKYCGAIMMDLSKAFDVIPHGLLLAKLHAYGFKSNCLELIADYLKDRYQRTKLSQARSSWTRIKKGVPQGSILGPTLFNIFINDMLFCVKDFGIYNYADDNTVSYACDSYDDLVKTLEMCGDKLTEWFTANGMQANPEKYQAIVFGNKPDVPSSFCIKGEIVKCIDSVRLLGVEIDSKLNFNHHVSDLCKKASRQLNSAMRLINKLDFDVRKTIYTSFLKSTFSYCPVVWMFCGQGNIKKLERIQYRALKFVFNDFETSYEDLLQRNNDMSISTYLKFTLCVEVYKCMNNLSPHYLSSLFERKNVSYNMRDDCKIMQKRFNRTMYGYYSFSYYGSKLWNDLPVNVKTTECLNEFKNKLKIFLMDESRKPLWY